MIKLNYFNVELFDFKNPNHIYIMNKMESESGIKYIVGDGDLKSFLMFHSCDDNGNSYIVKDKEKTIGLIGTIPYDELSMELWCSILEEHRNQGYSKKILMDISKNIKNFKLIIDNDNICSIKSVSNAGYVKICDYDLLKSIYMLKR